MMRTLMLLLALLSGGAHRQEADTPAPEKVSLTVNLAKEGALARFDRSDPKAWRLVTEKQEEGEGESHCLDLHAASDYQPPHRSPLNLALLRDWEFADFVLDVEMRQTGREYGHRDLCLFFAFEKPDRFCYVHLASVADQNAHNIFRVEEAPRRNYATKTTAGVAWGETWHHIRLVRSFKDGKVQVFFDDLSQPVMEAVEEDPQFGRLGFGSFDDTGRFRNLRIQGTGRRLPKDAPSAFPSRPKDGSEDH